MAEYIEREAVLDLLTNRDVVINPHDEVAYIREDVECLPAADVRPVVKAKWVWLSSTYDRTPCEMRYQCSNCHHETITHNSEPWEKFCPNCGAMMEKS